VKRFTAQDGHERLWFDPGEIEEIMEYELQKANLFPSLENPVVDIEVFIEQHLLAHLDQHANLDATTLGVTEFRAGAKPLVKINKDLTNSALDEEGGPPYLVGRWRATLAHEGAHIILHRRLFNLNPQQRGFFDTGEEPYPEPNRLLRCLKRDVCFGGNSKNWREIQANMGMAAILMPGAVFAEAFHQELGQANLARVDRDSPEARQLATSLGAKFQVSRQAAQIRLQTLGLLAIPGQLELM
jgi:hypothetical protein